MHVFSVDFLQRTAKDTDSLPFHRAFKKVPFVNAIGQTVEPTEPNAIKFEKFIFDLMPLAQNPIVVEAEEREVFAPLKNASGAAKDTPESTRDAIVAKHTRMLESAGATVKASVKVEINPLFALDIAEKLQQPVGGLLTGLQVQGLTVGGTVVTDFASNGDDLIVVRFSDRRVGNEAQVQSDDGTIQQLGKVRDLLHLGHACRSRFARNQADGPLRGGNVRIALALKSAKDCRQLDP